MLRPWSRLMSGLRMEMALQVQPPETEEGAAADGGKTGKGWWSKAAGRNLDRWKVVGNLENEIHVVRWLQKLTQ